MAPRWPQEAPSRPQDDPKMAHDGPRWPQMAPRWPIWPMFFPRSTRHSNSYIETLAFQAKCRTHCNLRGFGTHSGALFALGWPQGGPKMASRWPQDCSRWPQDDPKMAQDWPRWPMQHPNSTRQVTTTQKLQLFDQRAEHIVFYEVSGPIVVSSGPQDGPKMGSSGARIFQRGAQEAPRWF